MSQQYDTDLLLLNATCHLQTTKTNVQLNAFKPMNVVVWKVLYFITELWCSSSIK